jgi:hypothetical protein
VKIRLRQGLAAAWTAANPVLAQGEPGLATDTRSLRIGDGVSTWSALPSYVLDVGTANLVLSGNLSVAGAALGMRTPATHGLSAWSLDPCSASATSAPTSGRLYLVRLYPAETGNVTTVHWLHTAAGAGPVAGQNWVGAYAADGTLLASAATDGIVAAAGLQSVALAFPRTAGVPVWIAYLWNAAGNPTVARGSNVSFSTQMLNVGLAATDYAFALGPAGLVALPSPAVPAAFTSGINLWMAMD